MKFGEVRVGDAQGAILAHSTAAGRRRLKKGHVLTGDDIGLLREAGIEVVIAAALEAGDLGEDAAAAALAETMPFSGASATKAATGRVNFHADHDGLFVADKAAVDALNRIDPSVTLACLDDHKPVTAGTMVATIKIIPLAVDAEVMDRARALLTQSDALFAVKPWRARRVGLVATELPTLKAKVMDKTAKLLSERLAVSGSTLHREIRVPHRADSVAAATAELAGECDLVIVFGASAVTDAYDVIPAAIRQAGGMVERVGMPVDPGNLLVVGAIGDVPVLGAPGCARSPKENGFDWVLARIMAGETPSGEDIAGMGVGGLLMEIPTRPQPRAGAASPDAPVDIVVLAAGRSSRMGADAGHKLLAGFDGVPLVRRSVETALEAATGKVIVVTGYRADEIAEALSGLDVEIVENPDYASGMASSLVAGINAVSDKAAGALIHLADMPVVAVSHLTKMTKAFHAAHGLSVVRAASGAKRGNPVILPRDAFAMIRQLTGDVGARGIIESGKFEVVDVDIGEAAEVDVDTPAALKAAGGVPERDARQETGND